MSENTPRAAFGPTLANRRCSERHTVDRLGFEPPAEEFARPKDFGPDGGKSEADWLGLSYGTARRDGDGLRTRTNRLTGPDADSVRTMNAGSHESPDKYATIRKRKVSAGSNRARCDEHRDAGIRALARNVRTASQRPIVRNDPDNGGSPKSNER